jgi:exopolysaccharide production protein ExoZ
MRAIVSIQALRGIAALAVVLSHFDQLRLWLTGFHGDYPLEQLACGVDLFFVISGFVMVYSSGDLFAADGGAATFLAKRIARIVPPYWLVTLIAIPLLSLPTNWGSLVGSFLFFPFRAPNDNIVPIYGVGWTLNFEMYFYALFSMVIFLRRDIAVPALCIILSAIVLLGHWLRPALAPLAFWSDPIILEFVFGMILAMLYIKGIRLQMPLRLFLVAAGVVAIGFFNTRMPPSAFRVVQWGIPAAMILAGTVLGKDINFGWLGAPLQVLGNASYALYLIHSLMSGAILIGWHHGLNRYPEMLVLFLGLAAAQLISIAMYYFFERGSTKFLQRTLLGRARAAPGLVAAQPT